MTVSRQRAKGRKESGSFVALPHRLLNSEEFGRLSAHAVKLLIDLISQYNGKNNGDLCAAWGMMSKRNWKSKGTLDRAKKELLEAGFIINTRMGGRHKAALYGVTFRPIDECKGKLEVLPNVTASHLWKDKNRNATPYKGQCAPYESQSANVA